MVRWKVQEKKGIKEIAKKLEEGKEEKEEYRKEKMEYKVLCKKKKKKRKMELMGRQGRREFKNKFGK